MLLDTNIVIYACKPGGEWLETWTNGPETALASVTRIESLGYAGISRNEDDFKHIEGLTIINPFAVD